mgnify:CR=1 FL=1
MNINELRRLVKETIAETKRPKRDKNFKTIAESIALLSERTDKTPAEKVSEPVRELVDKLEQAAKDGAVDKLHKLLDTKEGMSQELHYILNGGLNYDGANDDDVVKITDEERSVMDLSPTQNEIDFMKSTSFGCSLKSSLEGAMGLWGPKQGGAISVAGNLVLDGHHRWSGCFALNPFGKIQVRNFEFPAGVDSDGQKLCALQLAVAAKRSPGQALPSATAGKGTNILGASKSSIMGHFESAMFQPVSAGDQSGEVLGDEYIGFLKEMPEAASELFDLTPEEVSMAFTKEQILGGMRAEDCPARGKIMRKVADNLSALPENPQAPARSDMPQLDHDDIGGKGAFSAMRSELQGGELNVNTPFLDLEESVDLRRWNKLAGILKD